MNTLESKILEVLMKYGSEQINLGSESARKLIAQDLARKIEDTFCPLVTRVTRPLDDTLTIDMEDTFI